MDNSVSVDNKSFKIHTFGCKVNTYDTGLLQKRLYQAGYVSSITEPKIHILNTCAVTAEATKDAVRTARRIKSKNPFSTVVVTGCAAQVDTNSFKDASGVDLVVANSHKGDLEELLKKYFRGELKQKVFHSNIFKKEDLEAGGGIEQNHTRAFLKIQDGCNSFCTYCVIPFARGKSRSIPIEVLVKKINELVKSGIKEVALTGVHIGDYGYKLNGNRVILEDLIENVLEKTSVPRIRLTSLEPIELTDRLLSFYKNPRMCPHFHMSIQSANTDVLKSMKRKYTQDNVIQSLEQIKRNVPNAFVGMDVIVGFPGETDERFKDTYECLKKLPWTRIHVFPYSERPGTKATSIEDKVPVHTRKERAKLLRELSSERYAQEALKQIGIHKQALVLKKKESAYQAVSGDYWSILIDTNEELQSSAIYDVKISGYDHSESSRMDGLLRAEVTKV